MPSGTKPRAVPTIARPIRQPTDAGTLLDAFLSAAEYGNLSGVQLLMGLGVDVHWNDNFALVMSLAKGHADIVPLLLPGTPVARVKNQLSCIRVNNSGSQTRIIKELINYVVYASEINVIADDIILILSKAVDNRCVKLVKFLLYLCTINRLDAPLDQYLVTAVNWDCDTMIEMLIEAGANPNANDSRCMQDVDLDIDTIQLFVEAGASIKKLIAPPENNVYSYYSYSCTYLSTAVYEGNVAVVKAFIKEGESINFISIALEDACETSNVELVRVLIEAGADVNFAHTPYPVSLACCSIDVVRTLIDAGTIVNPISLISAVEHNNYQMIELLADNCSRQTLADVDLTLAAKHGQLDVLKEVIKDGGNIHAADDLAFRYACYNGNVDMTKFLIQSGLNSPRNQTIAFRAFIKYNSLDMIKFLIKSGADIDRPEAMVLSTAATYGRVQIIKALIKAGINVPNNNNWAIRNAAEEGHIEVIRILSKAGSDIHAINRCHSKAYRFLIGEGLDPKRLRLT